MKLRIKFKYSYFISILTSFVILFYFAYKGVVGAVAGLYLILLGLAFFNIYKYNSELQIYDTVIKEHSVKEKQLQVLKKELKLMTTTLKLSTSLKSNKE